MNKRNRIVIYNLEMNESSKVLAANIDWVETFAKNFEHVTVFTVHKGHSSVSENVEVIELGGGTLILKIRAVLRLLINFFRILPFIGHTVVFHHMSSKTASTIGILYRLFKVPQGLWYSHSRFQILDSIFLFNFTRKFSIEERQSPHCWSWDIDSKICTTSKKLRAKWNRNGWKNCQN